MVLGGAWSQGVPGPGAGAWCLGGSVCAWSQGVPGPWSGGCAWSWRGGIPSCTEADLPCEQNENRCKNITLPQTSFTGGKNCIKSYLTLQHLVYMTNTAK